jgi:hypothetical protein
MPLTLLLSKSPPSLSLERLVMSAAVGAAIPSAAKHPVVA